MEQIKLKLKKDRFRNVGNSIAVKIVGTKAIVHRKNHTYSIPRVGPHQYAGQFTGKANVLKLAFEHKIRVATIWWSLTKKEA